MNFSKTLRDWFRGTPAAPAPAPPAANELQSLLDAFIEEARKTSRHGYWYNVAFAELPSYEPLRSLPPARRADLIRYLFGSILEQYPQLVTRASGVGYSAPTFELAGYLELFKHFLRSKLPLEQEDAVQLLSGYRTLSGEHAYTFHTWPIHHTLRQLEYAGKRAPLTGETKRFLEDMLTWPEFRQQDIYTGMQVQRKKLEARIQDLIRGGKEADAPVAPVRLTEDRFGQQVNADVLALSADQRQGWYRLFREYSKATAGKPSQKYLQVTSAEIDGIGTGIFKKQVHAWLEHLLTLDPVVTERTQQLPGYNYTYYETEFVSKDNQVFLKGLVWSLTRFHDRKTLELLARLTEVCFKKVPQLGPVAAGLGNACIYALGQVKGMDGIAHLSRLKLRVKQTNTRKLIQKYLTEASEQQGLTPSALEERVVPDFGLVDGKREIPFDGYLLELAVTGIGRVVLRWIKPDGTAQKSVPAFVRDSAAHRERLKKAKKDVAQIKQQLTAQRDRIDRLYREDRRWTYADLAAYYLDHGLVGFIARRLIWTITGPAGPVPALLVDGRWTDRTGRELPSPAPDGEVRLWHPIESTREEVLQWRERLDTLTYQQAMKQAYREVYFLTDAELTTGVYSNRMAAHLLKQHQFAALARLRDWRYALMGAYDDGRESEQATLPLPAFGLQAEFWIDEVNADDAFNEAGIWNYVATDQLRFRTTAGQTLPLADVPPLVLSEVMRDADLFVGICSVGNDPQWRDTGGLRQYRDYWTNYSFGELNEVAKTRRDIIEKLLPRLKIRDVAALDGRFLTVRGMHRTYKIHLGSTNILMEPNDQYLCIVPDRGAKEQGQDVFLPFEGDRGLSIILSKALLLADDDRITDPTILSQIHRR